VQALLKKREIRSIFVAVISVISLLGYLSNHGLPNHNILYPLNGRDLKKSNTYV